MKSLSSYFIEKNNVKIRYIRNVYGYKTGVVVKVGKGADAKYGWSSVHSTTDVEYKFVKPHQTPIYQWMVNNEVPFDIILSSSFYHQLLDNACFIPVPRFDREIALTLAFNRALKNEFELSKNGRVVLKGNVPRKDNLILALNSLAQED